MQALRRPLVRRTLVLSVLLACLGAACVHEGARGPAPEGEPSVDTGGLVSDPFFYRNDSVAGEVRSGVEHLPGALILVVDTGEIFRADETGTYVIQLELGERDSARFELKFSAPGYRARTETVTVRRNQQTKLDVELEAL